MEQIEQKGASLVPALCAGPSSTCFKADQALNTLMYIASRVYNGVMYHHASILKVVCLRFDKNVAQLFSEFCLPVPSTCCKQQTKALVVPALHVETMNVIY